MSVSMLKTGKTGFMPTKMGAPRPIINYSMILLFLAPSFVVVNLKQKTAGPN
jgi:hypothetical protein